MRVISVTCNIWLSVYSTINRETERRKEINTQNGDMSSDQWTNNKIAIEVRFLHQTSPMKLPVTL